MNLWLPALLLALLAVPVLAFADTNSQIVNGGSTPVLVSVVNTGFGGSGIFTVTFTQQDNPGKLVRNDNFTLTVSQNGNIVYNASKVYGQPIISSPSGTRIFDMALVPNLGYTAHLIVYGVSGAAVPQQSFDFTYENGKYTSTPEFPLAPTVAIAAIGVVVLLMRLAARAK